MSEIYKKKVEVADTFQNDLLIKKDLWQSLGANTSALLCGSPDLEFIYSTIRGPTRRDGGKINHSSGLVYGCRTSK